MAEHLDDFLPGHHFLNEAVDAAQIRLLRDKVLARQFREFGGRQHLERQQDERENRHNPRIVQHGEEHHDDGNRAVDDFGDALADELAQGVHVVGVDGHDVAVRVRVKVADRQGLHVREQVRADFEHRALADADHQALADVAGGNAQREDAAQRNHGIRQIAHGLGAFLNAGDVHIHQIPRERAGLNGGIRRHHNADDDGNELPQIVFKNDFHQALEDVSLPLDGHAGHRSASAARASHHCASPPFIWSGLSKSPPPDVCVS